MKKMFTKNSSVLKLVVLAGIVVGCLSLSNRSYGQTYYSKFADPTGKYATYDPTGDGCSATGIQNPLGFVNSTVGDFSYFTANISSPYTCTTNYKFDTYLNLPPDSFSLSAGSVVGFTIRVPTGISPDSLGKYIIIGTFLVDSAHNPTFQEYRTGNNLSGLDAGQGGVNWAIYFTTTKPLNVIELSVDPKIVQLNKNFEFDVFYGTGSHPLNSLPAQITNIITSVAGKKVNVSWQSLTETNVSHYRIERSSNGGASYSPVANVSAKSNSNAAASYGYTDNVSIDGNYLYRIVIVNKDGSSRITNSVAAAISGLGKLLLYPTIVKSGQNITVKTSENGLVTVSLYDGVGRLVKQQRTASTGQFSIGTAGLSTGGYHVKIVSPTGNVLQSKIVVN